MYHYILKINSRESNYKVTTNPIQVSYNNTGNSSLIQRITIKGASIPHVFYNVNSTNNVLIFFTIVTNYTVTFPIGQYTVNSLISYFNSTSQSISSGVSLSFNTLTNKIYALSVSSIAAFTTNSTCFQILGLRKGEEFVFQQNINTPLLYMPDFSGIRNIYAETSFSNMNCLDSNGYKSYGAFIPIDKPFGSIIHYINQEQDLNDIIRTKTYSQNLNKIEIALRDVDGNLIDLQNQNWEITFKIVLSHEHDLVDN